MSRQIALGEVATIIMGQSPDSHLCNDEEKGIAFLQGCAEFGDKFPIPKNYCIAPKKLSPKDSILISVRAPVGDLNLADREYVIGRGLAGIVPIKTSRNFLYYSIQQYKNQLERVSQGSTFAAINSADLYNFLINIYPLPHQRKIARILTTVDNIIEKTEAAIAKYKAIKQGMMHDLFTRGIDVKTGKLRPKFEDASQLYKESPLGWIPKEWEVKRLDEIGQVVTGNTPSTTNQKYYGSDYLFISPADIGKTKYLVDSEKKLSVLGYKISRGIPVGSICVVCIGSTIGKMAINRHDCATNQQINTIITNNNTLNEYYYYSINRYVKKQLYIEAGLQAVPIVNKSTFEKLKIAMPHNEKESDTIAKRLGSMDAYIEKLTIEEDKLLIIKQGLMQDLLTGRKEVTPDPEDYQEIEN
jgi:type I restriction enzyme S subunit